MYVGLISIGFRMEEDGVAFMVTKLGFLMEENGPTIYGGASLEGAGGSLCFGDLKGVENEPN